MNDYVLGATAVADLEEIWDYIAKDNPNAADRWIARLFEAFEMIARMRAIGHTRKDLASLPVLFWPVGEYLVVYRAEENRPVVIEAVTQGSRDIPSFLGRGLS